MKFIHTSDWHLGRQLHNHSLLDDQRHVLNQIIALAEVEAVDAVVIAGDIYDRSVPPANAVALLDDTLNRLVEELGIPVVMIAGNHDGHERLGFGARQMVESGLYITGPLTDNLDPVILGDGGKTNGVAFYGLPYADPVTVREVFGADDEDVQTHEQAMQLLLAKVKADDVNGLPKVVGGHCFLDGGDESDSERPLSIGGADKISPALFTEFNYVALGHLHGPQKKGADHVRYSGSILKYSFSEQHQKKSVTLVDLDAEGNAAMTLVPLQPMRDMRIIEGFLDELLAAGETDVNRDDYLMVRLLDKHAILDAMGKLRAVFPNVMHLERTGLMAQNENLVSNREHIGKSERLMFTDFFEQVSGESLSEAQLAVLDATLETLHKAEREA